MLDQVVWAFRAVTSLMGPPTGSGKDDFLRTLSRMNDKVSGYRYSDVLLGGRSIFSYRDAGFRRQVGMPARRIPFPMSIMVTCSWRAWQTGAAQGIPWRRAGSTPRSASRDAVRIGWRFTVSTLWWSAAVVVPARTLAVNRSVAVTEKIEEFADPLRSPHGDRRDL